MQNQKREISFLCLKSAPDGCIMRAWWIFLADIIQNRKIKQEEMINEKIFGTSFGRYDGLLAEIDEKIKAVKEEWSEGKIINMYDNDSFDIVDRYVMGYYEDTHSYEIGVTRL